MAYFLQQYRATVQISPTPVKQCWAAPFDVVWHMTDTLGYWHKTDTLG